MFKTNWQNNALKYQRRNKWICALKIALASLEIWGPDGAGNPSPAEAGPTGNSAECPASHNAKHMAILQSSRCCLLLKLLRHTAAKLQAAILIQRSVEKSQCGRLWRVLYRISFQTALPSTTQERTCLISTCTTTAYSLIATSLMAEVDADQH